jgi:hypothetical protein
MLLTILSVGQCVAEFGTKVQAGDPDVGLPLSPFSAVGGTGGGVTTQAFAFVSYWDIGSTPGIYDDKDPVYLQFGSAPGTAARIAREGNVRLTDCGPYSAGSKVKAGDSDIGQQLLPWAPAVFASGIATGFYYMNVVGGGGYSLGDPIFI